MRHKLGLLFVLGISCSACLHAQRNEKDPVMEQSISLESTSKIINTLAANDMEGRKFGTPGIHKAAAFISSEFKKAGLEIAPGDSGYYQNFQVVSSQIIQKELTVDGQSLSDTASLIISTQPEISIDENSGYVVIPVKDIRELSSTLSNPKIKQQNTIVLLANAVRSVLPRLKRFQQNQFPSDFNTIYLVGDKPPGKFSLKATNQLTSLHLANIVGILPGKSRKEELVIFSGHYDHLGIDPSNKEDSIYNGANDDASGTTAVIQLAKYYAKLHNNERTLVFAAFTAEEAGGFGSTYFSHQFDPAKVMAMFNIEMIGTDSKWGNNSAYITGYEKTDMGEILQKNLGGTDFSFHPDPYTDQHLFYRSDNATLARQGVAAHTISTSKMDAEPNYHKVSDEVSTLNLSNMNNIIRSIALSAKSIIQGKDTPSRVDVSTLD